MNQFGRFLKRFIPAIAGNAASMVGTLVMRAVHPRDRGERTMGATISFQYDGSSPRSRGTHIGSD